MLLVQAAQESCDPADPRMPKIRSDPNSEHWRKKRQSRMAAAETIRLPTVFSCAGVESLDPIQPEGSTLTQQLKLF